MIKELAVATAALFITAGSAYALTIVNEDAKEYTLRVDLGEKETTHKIPANETVKLQKEVCPASCGEWTLVLLVDGRGPRHRDHQER